MSDAFKFNIGALVCKKGAPHDGVARVESFVPVPSGDEGSTQHLLRVFFYETGRFGVFKATELEATPAGAPAHVALFEPPDSSLKAEDGET